MRRPRCGVKDNFDFNGGGLRRKRYSIIPGIYPWQKRTLTYRVTKYSRKLSRADVDSEIARAAAVWSEHIDMTFIAKPFGEVDFEIKFVEGAHSSGCEALDGPGHVLAHAFGPPRGDVHFDDSEDWVAGDNTYGVSLFHVAAHELGHSLGLEHSNVYSALMYPTATPKSFSRLDDDDIRVHEDIISRIV